MKTLNTNDEIDGFLSSGQPGCVVGLTQHGGHVIIELPRDCNYMTMTADDAEEMAECLKKWAAESRIKRKDRP